MSDPAHNKFEMLERTVLELGTELFHLKGTIVKSQESHTQFLAIIKGLKQLLDEKGVIHAEDFDAAVQLGEALEHFSSQYEYGLHREMEKLKKSGH